MTGAVYVRSAPGYIRRDAQPSDSTPWTKHPVDAHRFASAEAANEWCARRIAYRTERGQNHGRYVLVNAATEQEPDTATTDNDEPTALSITKRLASRGLLDEFRSIARQNGVTLTELFSQCRAQRIVNARRQCWAFLREKSWSYPDIGGLFKRSHSTVQQVLEGHPTRRAGRLRRVA